MREVFISYSRIDKSLVLAIKAELEKNLGVQCWMDLNNIESGNPAFDNAIVKGIEECRVFLFMLSVHSQKSDWAINEMELALKISKETNGKVKPVMVNIDGCELSHQFFLRYNRMDIILWNNIDQKAKLLRDIRRWTNKEGISDDVQSTPNQEDLMNSSLSIEDIVKRAKVCETSEGYREAFKLYMQAAHLGNALAQFKVAYKLCVGKGVEKDEAEALNWCRKAVAQDYAPAKSLLGRMYLNGRGVEQNYHEALNWILMSANQGYVYAQKLLGDLFLKGRGEEIPQDYQKAASWYRKAAENGNAEAQYQYGNMFYHGYGVDQDYVEAVVWFRKSAEQDNPDALITLGDMYGKGIGVNKNLAECAKYLGLAMTIYQRKAERGDKKAMKKLAKLKEKKK